MTDFDWKAVPRRPFTKGDVWELLKNGCNRHEIAVAAGVTEAVALGMIFEAMPDNRRRGRLTRSGSAPSRALASADGMSSSTRK